MAALLAGLEIFHDAGMNLLRQKSEKLTSYLESLIKSELDEKVEIITPSSPQSRGCQLSLRVLSPMNDITKLLHDRGVISDWRDPNVIRIAPVPLYNSFQDCYDFIQVFKDIFNEKG
jgi:kynureninase